MHCGLDFLSIMPDYLRIVETGQVENGALCSSIVQRTCLSYLCYHELVSQRENQKSLDDKLNKLFCIP